MLISENPDLKILTDFEILEAQNPELKIFENQKPEFKILRKPEFENFDRLQDVCLPKS